jgi:hypothetical protein
MERDVYRISIFGDFSEVYLEFFMNMRVMRKSLAGDTWFFTIENGDSSITFSIYEGTWNRVVSDMRSHRIDSVIS